MLGWSEKDDPALLAHIQDGSHDAFAVLVQRYTERFYRLAYRYVHNKETAEDLVQEAFLKLWVDPSRWQPERNTKFTTWFYRIVVNLCLDWQKKKRPLALDEEVLLADARETPDAELIRAQEQQVLEREIAALPERQRMALNLCPLVHVCINGYAKLHKLSSKISVRPIACSSQALWKTAYGPRPTVAL